MVGDSRTIGSEPVLMKNAKPDRDREARLVSSTGRARCHAQVDQRIMHPQLEELPSR